MYYVYLLKSQVSDKVYLGYTNDLKRRVKEHSKGMNKTTKKILPIKLVYYEAYESKNYALCREKRLKQYGAAYGHLRKRLKWSL